MTEDDFTADDFRDHEECDNCKNYIVSTFSVLSGICRLNGAMIFVDGDHHCKFYKAKED